MRNLIRKNIIPEDLKVNPGLRTVIRKKLESHGEEPMGEQDMRQQGSKT